MIATLVIKILFLILIIQHNPNYCHYSHQSIFLLCGATSPPEEATAAVYWLGSGSQLIQKIDDERINNFTSNNNRPLSVVQAQNNNEEDIKLSRIQYGAIFNEIGTTKQDQQHNQRAIGTMNNNNNHHHYHYHYNSNNNDNQEAQNVNSNIDKEDAKLEPSSDTLSSDHNHNDPNRRVGERQPTNKLNEHHHHHHYQLEQKNLSINTRITNHQTSSSSPPLSPLNWLQTSSELLKRGYHNTNTLNNNTHHHHHNHPDLDFNPHLNLLNHRKPVTPSHRTLQSSYQDGYHHVKKRQTRYKRDDASSSSSSSPYKNNNNDQHHRDQQQQQPPHNRQQNNNNNNLAAAVASSITTSSEKEIKYSTSISPSTSTTHPISSNENKTHHSTRVSDGTMMISASSSSAQTPTAATASNAQEVNVAELCYLSNGGSSLTLTVNEATPIGSIIGTIDVNGDPSLDGGNVELFIDYKYFFAQNGAYLNSVTSPHNGVGSASTVATTATTEMTTDPSSTEDNLLHESPSSSVSPIVGLSSQQRFRHLRHSNENKNLFYSHPLRRFTRSHSRPLTLPLSKPSKRSDEYNRLRVDSLNSDDEDHITSREDMKKREKPKVETAYEEDYSGENEEEGRKNSVNGADWSPATTATTTTNSNPPIIANITNDRLNINGQTVVAIDGSHAGSDSISRQQQQQRQGSNSSGHFKTKNSNNNLFAGTISGAKVNDGGGGSGGGRESIRTRLGDEETSKKANNDNDDNSSKKGATIIISNQMTPTTIPAHSTASSSSAAFRSHESESFDVKNDGQPVKREDQNGDDSSRVADNISVVGGTYSSSSSSSLLRHQSLDSHPLIDSLSSLVPAGETSSQAPLPSLNGTQSGSRLIGGELLPSGRGQAASVVSSARFLVNGTNKQHRRSYSNGADTTPAGVLLSSGQQSVDIGTSGVGNNKINNNNNGNSSKQHQRRMRLQQLTTTGDSLREQNDLTGELMNQHQNLLPIRIELGTRNLILTRQLDKEGIEGEQNLMIGVRCRPKPPDNSPVRDLFEGSSSTTTTLIASSETTSDKSRPLNKLGRSHHHHQAMAELQPLDSTMIPVRIIVTDANDHAPVFAGPQPYVVNVSETAPVGTIVFRDIIAHDADSAGSFSTLDYHVQEGPYSALLQFQNPLEPLLVVVGQLDFETLPQFTLTVIAQDQGDPQRSASAAVQVNVQDFDDQNPRFFDDKYTIVMDGRQENLVGQPLQVLPRNLHAEDGDRGIKAPIVYSFNEATNQDHEALNYIHLNSATGEVRLIRQWPASMAPVTLVVRATQVDNKDRYTLTTLTITRYPPSGPMAHSSASFPANSDDPAKRDGGSSSSSFAIGQQHRPKLGYGIEFAQSNYSCLIPENTEVGEKVLKVSAHIRSPMSVSASNTNTNNSKAKDQLDDGVDLVLTSPPPGTTSSIRPTTSKVLPSPTNLTKQVMPMGGGAVFYQLLDEELDLFGINGLGDIYLKRPLDYEHKQEHEFRVLATQGKYSDIVHVQVQVLNVNDNSPKFSQHHYQFYVTEARLKSTNTIGQITVQDGDLDDKLQLKLLQQQQQQQQQHDRSSSSSAQVTAGGNCLQMFQIDEHGHLSVQRHLKQLMNITQCQFQVQAKDSLAPTHTALAPVTVHISPQLIGRSLNFDHLQTEELTAATNNHHHQQHQEPMKLNHGSTTNRQLNARSGNSLDSLSTTSLVVASSSPAPSSTRSSVSTMMASLQHLIKNVLFDTSHSAPTTSAVALSIILAFLLGLLFILIISMSVHMYRRKSSSTASTSSASSSSSHNPLQKYPSSSNSASSSQASARSPPPPPPPPLSPTNINHHPPPSQYHHHSYQQHQQQQQHHRRPLSMLASNGLTAGGVQVDGGKQRRSRFVKQHQQQYQQAAATGHQQLRPIHEVNSPMRATINQHQPIQHPIYRELELRANKRIAQSNEDHHVNNVRSGGATDQDQTTITDRSTVIQCNNSPIDGQNVVCKSIDVLSSPVVHETTTNTTTTTTTTINNNNNNTSIAKCTSPIPVDSSLGSSIGGGHSSISSSTVDGAHKTGGSGHSTSDGSSDTNAGHYSINNTLSMAASKRIKQQRGQQHHQQSNGGALLKTMKPIGETGQHLDSSQLQQQQNGGLDNGCRRASDDQDYYSGGGGHDDDYDDSRSGHDYEIDVDNGEMQLTGRKRNNTRRSSNGPVGNQRDEGDADGDDDDDDEGGFRSTGGAPSNGNRRNKVSALPGIKSYRHLPTTGSLIRPFKHYQKIADAVAEAGQRARNNKVSPIGVAEIAGGSATVGDHGSKMRADEEMVRGGGLCEQDSAIASDESSSSRLLNCIRGKEDNIMKPSECQDNDLMTAASETVGGIGNGAGGLMAMVKQQQQVHNGLSSAQLSPNNQRQQHQQQNALSNTAGFSVPSRVSVIKWPQGSIPRRVKKLTWDDEASLDEQQRLSYSSQMITADMPPYTPEPMGPSLADHYAVPQSARLLAWPLSTTTTTTTSAAAAAFTCDQQNSSSSSPYFQAATGGLGPALLSAAASTFSSSQSQFDASALNQHYKQQMEQQQQQQQQQFGSKCEQIAKTPTNNSDLMVKSVVSSNGSKPQPQTHFPSQLKPTEAHYQLHPSQQQQVVSFYNSSSSNNNNRVLPDVTVYF